MGGDAGPSVVVPGALAAVASGPPDLDLVLVGREDEIRSHLSGRETPSIRVAHASEVIGMSEPPAAAFRKKKDSSIAVGTRLVRDGEADGFVSAGNTGAVVASSLVNMGRLHLVSRPAIATLWPSKRGGAVVLDVGANYECVPKNLVQFAVMGAVYARHHLKIPQPRVGLLNIGEERSKGNDLVKSSYELLEQAPGINFVGNVEGRDVFDGAADVVVCDGFVGNVILKFSESIFSFLSHMVRDEIRKGVVAKAGALLMRGAFTNVRAQLDYAEYGGAPLLGVRGATIISHGKSSERAIKNAILAATRAVSEQINDHIEESLKQSEQHVAKVS
jgi:glycerol-3-phosphate acyltransferase PlsX